MRIKKLSIWCDRCGKEMDSGTDEVTTVRIIPAVPNPDSSFDSTAFDLCYPCRIEFLHSMTEWRKRFISGKREGGKKEGGKKEGGKDE